MSRGHFHPEAFYAALDAVRVRRQMTWKQIADKAGVSASTLTRMAQGRRPDVDSLAALTDWSGLDFNDYTVAGRHAEGFGNQALEKMTGLFRADPNLTPEARSALETTLKVMYQTLRTKTKED